jgi:hypothetical protein
MTPPSTIRFAGVKARTLCVGIGLCVIAGCATVKPAGVDYRGVPVPARGEAPAAPPARGTLPAAARDWRAAGVGQDAAFERSNLLSDTFYKNADLLLQQVERTGAMGVNRGWESGARKGGDWYIEEQRFADTVIGAGVNRNRVDLIDAGLRALEWGFQQQAADGSFDCKDNFFSASYFIAAAAHSIWLLETTGYARDFSGRIGTLRAALVRSARWLADPKNFDANRGSYDNFTSRYFLTGYALAASGRLLGEANLALAGEDMVRVGSSKQNPAGYFPERGGFDVTFQAESLVYLLRFHDHAASAEARRATEPVIRNALVWLESRTQPNGIVLTVGNTRSGAGQERDRTGQARRVSAVAVARALGLARHVLGDNKFEVLARSVATARQPG